MSLLEQQLAEAVAKRQEAEQNVADRFREIAQLTRMLMACEEALTGPQRKVGVHREPLSDSPVRSGEVTIEVQVLRHSVDSLQLDLRRAREESGRLAYRLTALNGRLQEMEASRSWKLTYAFRTIAKRIRRGWKRSYRARTDLEVIKESPLFDGAWYLSTYRDVEASGKDPAEHYLLYGGFEGRNPSTLFNSERYLSRHQDVRASGINPLLHYEMYGKAEGRPTSAQRSLDGEPPASLR